MLTFGPTITCERSCADNRIWEPTNPRRVENVKVLEVYL